MKRGGGNPAVLHAEGDSLFKVGRQENFGWFWAMAYREPETSQKSPLQTAKATAGRASRCSYWFVPRQMCRHMFCCDIQMLQRNTRVVNKLRT